MIPNEQEDDFKYIDSLELFAILFILMMILGSVGIVITVFSAV